MLDYTEFDFQQSEDFNELPDWWDDTEEAYFEQIEARQELEEMQNRRW